MTPAERPYSNVVCTPSDFGDNAVAAAAVNLAGYRIPAGTPAPIVAVITFALAQLGKPYVRGATGPNAWGCSGLVQAAYAHICVRLPRTTFDQVDVGMYMGDSLLIQAPQSGEHVKLTPLSQWSGSIVAMRHVV